METNNESTAISDATAASAIVNLFINEINKQDVNGLLQVQESLFVDTIFFYFGEKINICWFSSYLDLIN